MKGKYTKIHEAVQITFVPGASFLKKPKICIDTLPGPPGDSPWQLWGITLEKAGLACFPFWYDVSISHTNETAKPENPRTVSRAAE